MDFHKSYLETIEDAMERCVKVRAVGAKATHHTVL